MSIYRSCRKMCPDFIVNDFVTRVIKTVPIREGYKTIRVTLKGDKTGDKTLQWCGATTLTVVCRKGCLVDVVDVVVRSRCANEEVRGVICDDLFRREVFFYNTVLPELGEFQEEVGVKLEERFRPPSLIGANEDSIILHNNVGVPKYEKWIGELTPDHVLIILKELSRFHALNFAFSKLKKARFEEFKNELHSGHLSVLKNEETARIIVAKLNNSLPFFEDDTTIHSLKMFTTEAELFLNSVSSESCDVNILLHGDPTTNFLFSYEKIENNNVLSRAKLTDWQLVKCGSPILDLSLFLFTNLDDFSNCNQLISEYHSWLGFYLKGYNCDVDEFFTFGKLQEHWKKYAKFGLAMSFLVLELICREPNQRPNANVEGQTAEEFLGSFVAAPNGEFVRRIREVVKFCVGNGLI